MGDVSGANLSTAGNVSADGNVSGTDISASGVLSGNSASITNGLSAGSVSTTGNVSADGNVTAGGTVTATGDVSGANLSTAGNVSGTDISASGVLSGNSASITNGLSAGSVSTTGNVSADGNVSGTDISASGVLSGDSASITNGLSAGSVSSTGDVTSGGKVAATGDVTAGGNVSATGNVSGTDLTATGNVKADGNVSGTNVSATDNVTAGGNVAATGNVTAGGNVAATGNVTSGGTITATGDISGANLSTKGNVTATGDVSGANISASGTLSGASADIDGDVTAGGNIAATGNISGTDISASGKLSGASAEIEGTVAAGAIETGAITAKDTTGNAYFTADSESIEAGYGEADFTFSEDGFEAGNGNATVSAGTDNAGKNFAALVADDSGFQTSEGVSEVKGGDTVLTVSDEGISAGGAQVKKIAAATEDTDAVNLGQAKGLQTIVKNGDNLTLSETENATGGREYTVSLAKDLEGLNSVETKQLQAGALTANDSGASVKTENAGFAVTKDAIAGVIGDPENPDSAFVLSKEGAAISSNGASVALANGTAAITGGNSAVVVTEGATALKGGSTVVTITDAGVNAGGAQLKNIAAATEDTDAVNLGQAKGLQTIVKNGDNLTLSETENATGGREYTVSLAKDLQGLNSVETKQLQAGALTANDSGANVKTENANLAVTKDAIAGVIGDGANPDSAFVLTKDAAVISSNGAAVSLGKEGAAIASGSSALAVTDGTAALKGGASTITLTDAGVAVNGVKVTGLAAGDISSAGSTDAVTGGQLYATNQAVSENASQIGSLWKKTGDLNKKINRTGANAAALAALHPLDYDEDHKVSASVGFGQYHGSGAAAVGVFIRPTENLMVNLGGAFSSDDRMMNAGLSYRFGASGQPYGTKAETAQKVSALTAENRDLAAQLAAANTKIEALSAEIEAIKEALKK